MRLKSLFQGEAGCPSTGRAEFVGAGRDRLNSPDGSVSTDAKRRRRGGRGRMNQQSLVLASGTEDATESPFKGEAGVLLQGRGVSSAQADERLNSPDGSVSTDAKRRRVRRKTGSAVIIFVLQEKMRLKSPVKGQAGRPSAGRRCSCRAQADDRLDSPISSVSTDAKRRRREGGELVIYI